MKKMGAKIEIIKKYNINNEDVADINIQYLAAHREFREKQ